ncbi:MFGE8 [Branchiostoma lanceolatum]|uniref:MFGE8 protein n=1 Tax=Branchiostoma lanceolatum TaxID=7740 RepID=A0A8K0EV23_BRALA|nr:MFGE8 [Branchiostoma lanceolatum]
MLNFGVVLRFFVYLSIGCLLSDEVASETKNDVCPRALGMEDRTIQDLDITSSSVATFFGVWWPWYARLNGDFAWLPNLALTTGSWIQVNLKEPMTVTDVITQGYDGPQDKFWITSYRILYLDTNLDWDIIRDQYNVTSPQTFPGNTDAAGQKTNMFDRPIVTRLIQLHPATWHGLPALRMELLGCDVTAPIGPAEVTSTLLPLSKAPIGPAGSNITASSSNADRTRQPTSSAPNSKNGASFGGLVAAGVATLTIKTLYCGLATTWHW